VKRVEILRCAQDDKITRKEISIGNFRDNLNLPIENYVLDYFVIPSQTLRRPFADPSQKLRALAQGFGSGHRLTLLFSVILNRALAE